MAEISYSEEAAGAEQIQEFVRLGEDLEAELAHPDALRDVASRVAVAADRLACRTVEGASHLGETIAGAAVAIANNGLKTYSKAEPTDSVLIVDGVLVSGTQISKTSRRLRAAGVKRTPAVVVVAAQVPGRVPPVEELLVLRGP